MQILFEADDRPSRLDEVSTRSMLPLHELMALEAVERLGSVQAAADALHLTPSGMSHRIASLEARVGVRLLERKGRGVALTPAAAAYVAPIRKGLIDLSRATGKLRSDANEVVRIATAAAIGAAWLLPRLKVRASAPDGTRLEILTVASPDELPPDRWDILIHYQRRPKRGSQRRLLFAEHLIAVCAPAASARRTSRRPQPDGRPILRLSQLDAGEPDFGLPTSAAGGAQMIFDDALAMLEAAAAGAGIAISTETAARPYLAAGRLVLASDVQLAGGCYFADLSQAGQRKPAAGALFRWLVEQARPGHPAGPSG